MSLLRRLMNRNMSLYDQLDTLAVCGITPRDGVGPPELLRLHGEREYETSPFKLLLTALGSESDEPPHLPMSDNVWHMHAECAARGGDYVRVAQRMATLAADALAHPVTSTTSSTSAAALPGSPLTCGMRNSAGRQESRSAGSIPTFSAASPRFWRRKTPTSATSASTSADKTACWVAPVTNNSLPCANSPASNSSGWAELETALSQPAKESQRRPQHCNRRRFRYRSARDNQRALV